MVSSPARARLFWVASVAALLAVLIASLPAAAVAPGWSTPKRVFQARFGPAHSMAIDSAGTTHIASEGGAAQGLWYISHFGGMGWFAMQLTHKVDMDPSIALDADGRVHIAFDRRDPDTGASKGLWTATNATGTFVVTKVHTGHDYDPSIAIRDDGSTKIVFRSGHRLLYLGHPGGPTVIDSSCCAGAPILRLTATGSVRVAYPDGSPTAPTGLRFAQRSGGVWHSSLVDGHAVRHVAMALEGSHGVNLAYDRPSGTVWALRTSGGWAKLQMNGNHGQPDIAEDGSGRTLIVTTTPGGNIWIDDIIADTIDSGPLTTSHMDFGPEVEFFGSHARVLFNRASGTTNDGLFLTRN